MSGIEHPHCGSVILATIVLLISSLCFLDNSSSCMADSVGAVLDVQADYAESYLFPSPEHVHLEDSDELAAAIASALGLQTPSRIDEAAMLNPSELSLLNANRTQLFAADLMISSFDSTENPDLLYNCVAYNCGAIKVCLFYDNLDESGRIFRALDIESSEGIVPSSSDFEECSKDIMARLNVPYESCEVRLAESSTTIIPIDDDTDDITTVNVTRVIFHSLVGGMDLWGGNNAGFKFDDDGQLTQLQCGAFMDIQSNLTIDSKEALEIAHSQVQNLLDDVDADDVNSEVIQGIRILPTATPVDGNLSGRANNIAYIYVADVENSLYGSLYWQFILVDADTGTILMSLQSIPGTPGTTPTPQGAEVSIPSVTTLLVTALAFGMILMAIVAGPIEMSYPVLSLLVAPLYLRIARTRVLDNFNRGRIYQFISGNPGASYSEIRSALRIPNGCIAYHLAVLERTGTIKIVVDGRMKRHYVISTPAPSMFAFLSRMQSRIVSALKGRDGGMSTSQIASELNVSRQRVHHNLKRLTEKGVLQSTPDGWVLSSTDHE